MRSQGGSVAGSSTMSSVVKFGLLAGGGYFLYRYFAPTLSGSPATAAPRTSASPSAPFGPSFNSLDATYTRLAAAVGATPYTVDQFNYYLQRELPAGKPAPDPDTFMPAGYDRTATMTLSQYWGAIIPKLKSDLGLSGLGLFGQLAVMSRYGRGW